MLAKRPPPAFERRLVAVAPGRSRAFDEAEWRDALVVVERGEIEIEGKGGRRRRFGQGDDLWLTGLPLRALHNPAQASALLVAVSHRRRRPSPEAPRSGSSSGLDAVPTPPATAISFEAIRRLNRCHVNGERPDDEEIEILGGGPPRSEYRR